MLAHESKNVIFLDIDGVLATDRNDVIRYQGNKAWSEFDPVAVELLNILCEKHNAKVVITSTWADDHKNRESLLTYFRQHGFTGEFHEDWRIETVVDVRKKRGLSIVKWCEEHNIGSQEYVIIDDKVFDLPKSFLPRFVRTDPANGLSLAAFVRAQYLFGKILEPGDDELITQAAHPSLKGRSQIV